MQITEKLDIPFQHEINQLAKIQVQQSEHVNLSIEKQFSFFSDEYEIIIESFFKSNDHTLIKKIELVDFMFELNLDAFDLPKDFTASFSLLKIITLKSALFHTSFFLNKHNPVAHYLRSISEHLKPKLTTSNSKECLNLLHNNIQTLINKYQTDPSFFDVQLKVILNTFKKTRALNNAANKSSNVFKTTSLKDSFSGHNNTAINTKINSNNNTHLLAAKNINKGDWLNFKEPNPLIKLIWKADDNSEFIFVNKSGQKVRQCSLLELASDLEQNIVSFLSNKSSNKFKNNSVLKTIG